MRLQERRAQEAAAARRSRFTLFAIVGIFVLGALLLFRYAGDDAVETAVDPPEVNDDATDDGTEPETVTITIPPAGAEIAGETPCPEADGSSERVTGFESAPPTCIDPSATYTATIATTKGDYIIDLDAAAAPETVNNFVVLARYHYYDGTAFHRIIPDFVIQGGDATGPSPGQGDPGYALNDELPQTNADGKSYELGSVAMANSGANSSGAQFFVVTGDTGVALPPSYSRFGLVTEGMDVVMAIEAVGTSAGTPTEEVIITGITITEQ